MTDMEILAFYYRGIVLPQRDNANIVNGFSKEIKLRKRTSADALLRVGSVA